MSSDGEWSLMEFDGRCNVRRVGDGSLRGRSCELDCWSELGVQDLGLTVVDGRFKGKPSGALHWLMDSGCP